MTNDKNELIIWNSKLSCGIGLIDEQHRKLVEIVNEMFNHVTGDEAQERDYFNRVIQETVKYTKLHFATEEKIMFVTKFEGYAGHKKEHEKFILTVLDNIHDYETENQFTLFDFTKFLKDWILSHIDMVDKQYFEYLKKITVKKHDNGKKL